MYKEFQKMVEEYRVPNAVLKKIEERFKEQSGEEFSLTSLQREVFSDKIFWQTDKNIIIKGATSAGKTLVSEIAAIYCLTQSPRNQVVILVPLKAMVRERCKLFQGDLSGKRVFAASSDYQDHDDDLLQGDYDVAVIVYEKFFALTAQNDSRLLEKCGLLIVDEIQMLSANGRGAKLEFSLHRILQWHQGIRIMGLTTTDAEVDCLQNWMHKAEVLGNDIRPVGLEEAIISTEGNIYKRVIKGETDSGESVIEQDMNNPLKEELELIAKLSSKASRDEKKNNLLISLLRKFFREDEKTGDARKIVVFTNSRNRTRKIAKLICSSNLIKAKEVSVDLKRKIENVDNEDSQIELLKSLLIYGVAFHNAALPVSLRQIIEDDFSELNGVINIIVATETLTIGMNMPTDIMILYDKTVYRSDHEERNLLAQEYKNFIGRAGRYGLANRIGQSFLIISPDEMEDCWRDYVYPKPTPVISSMLEYRQYGSSKEIASMHAPYYLNLITNRPLVVLKKNEIQIELLEQVEKDSFSNYCELEKGKIPVNDMLRWLQRAKVLERYEDDFLMESGIRLVKFGESMAPYALSCRTCYMIYTFLVHDGLKQGENKSGGLPYDTTKEDIANDKYLLDILFQICLTSEVTDSANLNSPEDNLRNTERFSETVSALLQYLKAYSAENTLWPNSALKVRFSGKDTPETEDINALMRAVILLHWTKGETLKIIKKNTGLNLPFVTGDIERLAEVCSYQLEAVSKAINCAIERVEKKLSAEFYRLSTRVKYGMKRELVLIANRHIDQLDRKIILKLGKVFDKYRYKYENIVVFLKEAPERELEGVITQAIREQIINMIDQRYLHDSLSILIDKMFEDGILESEERCAIRTFAEPGILDDQIEQLDGTDGFKNWTIAFEYIIKDILHLQLSLDREMGEGYYLVRNGNNIICFYLTMAIDELEEYAEKQCINWYTECGEKYEAKNLVIVGKVQTKFINSSDILILSATNFSGLAAQYVAEMGSIKYCWGKELVNLFMDLHGSLNGYGSGNLQCLVQNYAKKIPETIMSAKEDVIIVYDRSFPYLSFINEVQNILIKRGLGVRQTIWMQYDISKDFNGIILFFLGGNYIMRSSSILELSKKYYNSAYALWYLDEDKTISETAGYHLKGLSCSDSAEAAEYIYSSFVSFQSRQKFKYDVGISYRHHEGDHRMQKLAELLAECYGKDRVLFDKFHPELFASRGDAQRIEKLFRTECCYVIVGITNDYEESSWIYSESRGIHSMASSTPKERRVGFLILEKINNPENISIIDFGQDGTCELYNEDDDAIKGVFCIFHKTIDAAKSRLEGIDEGAIK